MTARLVECPGLYHSVGAVCGAQRLGPEADLVDWFLETFPLSTPAGCRSTIFREPRVATGFPDLVIVHWNEQSTEGWAPERHRLTDADMRVMHCLVEQRSVEEEVLKSWFSSDIGRRLERLAAA